MRFGIHNSSWLDSPDPAEAFEAVKTTAQWAEHHPFVWFSVMDHSGPNLWVMSAFWFKATKPRPTRHKQHVVNRHFSRT